MTRSSPSCYRLPEHGGKTHEHRTGTDPEACATISSSLGWRTSAASARAGAAGRARRAAGGAATDSAKLSDAIVGTVP